MASVDSNPNLVCNPLPANLKNDLTGRIFGRLTILGFSHDRPKPSGSYSRHWVCLCSCGVRKAVAASSLVSGVVLSCGCLQKERVRECHTTHGFSRIDGHKNALYDIWYSMHHRCENPSNHAFEKYGGRGITVCERWDSFETFQSDMGPRPTPEHSIDRIDNDKGYAPENCRWATKLVQTLNRKTTVMITFNGRTMPLVEWAEIVGISYDVLIRRYARGWPAEKLLTQPIQQKPRRR